METYVVTSVVNNARQDVPECVERADAPASSNSLVE
jgi:hypothetical protein